MTRRLSLPFLVLAVSSAAVLAPPSPVVVAADGESAADEAQLAALMSIVEEETDLATKSRMNSDYVPGLITILHGDDLEAQGVATVWEALALVPGMQPLLSENQSPSVIVRGIGFPFNSGNIKVQVNSVAASQDFSGAEISALLMPMEIVDRIEVIRGPGSSIYGNAAYAGLVNIITRQGSSGGYLRGGNPHARGVGGLLASHRRAEPLRLDLAAAGFEDDAAGYTDLVDGSESRRFAVLSLGYGDFSVQAHGLRREFSAFMPNPDPTPGSPAQRPVDADESLWSAQVAHRTTWSPGLSSAVTVAYLDDDYDGGNRVYRGNLTEGRIDLTWSGWTRQTWLLGSSYSDSKADEAAERRESPVGPPTLVSYGALGRSVWSLWIQDEIDMTDRLALTAGLRYDRFSDVDDAPVTPRLALVWRPAEGNILKAQYAEGFRAPTFWELYRSGERNPELSAETVGTTELSYVHRRAGSVARVTLFDCQFREMIYAAEDDLFMNREQASSRGLELEWGEELTGWLKADLNVTLLAHTEDSRARPDYSESPVAADWLGNLSLLAKPERHLTVGLQWHHVGDRAADLPEADSYDIVDLTVSWIDLLDSPLALRAGISNLFDDEPRYLIFRARGLNGLTYAGRSVWLKLSLQL